MNKINEKYDFTEETASKVKEKILEFLKGNDKNIFKRYLIYRSLSSVIDPDSYSNTLQKIYNEKWDKKYLDTCKYQENNNLIIVHSDTMTSAQTLLGNYYKQKGSQDKTLDWLKYKEKNPNAKYCSDVAMMNIVGAIEKGSKDYPVFKKLFLDDTSKACEFIKYYHTIGNYIPVPEYFNKSRSNYGKHDRWDLTLGKIYEYYHSNNKEKVIRELLHLTIANTRSNLKVIKATERWLNEFGTWQAFVEKNYLQDFVLENKEDYPIKKVFQDIYNWDNPLPKDFDYEAYFEEITKVIISRGKRILMDEVK